MTEIKPMSLCTLEQCTAVWNEGFRGYFVDMTMTVDRFTHRLVTEGLSPELSRVAFVDGQPAGLVLSGKQTVCGKTVAWNGGTAVVPRFRGHGVGKSLMEAVLQLYRAEQVEQATLEAIRDNRAAIALYRRMGFEENGKLISYRKEGAWDPSALPASASYHVERCHPRTIGRLPFYRDTSPWQTQWMNNLTGEGLIIRDSAGEAAGYGLYRKKWDSSGRVTDIILLQCETEPGRKDREEILRCALNGIYASENTSTHRCSAFNLPADNEALHGLLSRAGFQPMLEQIQMIRFL